MSGTMRSMEIDDTPLYGPRGLLVCGLEEEEAERFLALLHTLGWENLPVSFAGHDNLKTPVGKLFLEQPDNREALGGIAVIMAGITGIELQTLMKKWRASTLPRTLWATLTETSETWPLLTLLNHLAEEKREMTKNPPTAHRS